MSIDRAILFFAAHADGLNTDNTYKNAPVKWQSINTVTGKDKIMNSFLVWKTFMTCEDTKMFSVVTQEMKRITNETLAENSGFSMNVKKDIMSDQTMIAPKQYRKRFGSSRTRLGVTLYHCTANIKLNMWKSMTTDGCV